MHAQGEPGARRLCCLLRPLHVEPSLWPVLLRELELEMPDIAFTARDGPHVNVIWLCGFEPGRERAVRALRRAHPHASLVVTGRGPSLRWGPEVLAAGADHACSWPLAYEELSYRLHQPHVEGPVAGAHR